MQFRVIVAAYVFIAGCNNSNSGDDGDSGVAMDAGSSPSDSETDSSAAPSDSSAVPSDASPASSDASPAQPDDCTPGATRCSGPQGLERCNTSSRWQSLGQCSGVCSNNVCTGECGPGSSACCTSLANGADVRCSPASDPIVQVCTGGTSCEEPRVAFVRTCNELGEWVPVAPACPECLIAANDFVRYAMCRICPVAGVGAEARCDSTQDCLNGCGE